MLDINIPDFGHLKLEHLVMDYNGTLALDGHLLLGAREKLNLLAKDLHLHVITADTHQRAVTQLENLPLSLHIIPTEAQAETKLEYINKLGPENVVALGNGRNDRLMLAHAALGIAVIQKEGAASSALQSADIVAATLLDAFELLANPRHILATLRS